MSFPLKLDAPPRAHHTTASAIRVAVVNIHSPYLIVPGPEYTVVLLKHSLPVIDAAAVFDDPRLPRNAARDWLTTWGAPTLNHLWEHVHPWTPLHPDQVKSPHRLPPHLVKTLEEAYRGN